MESIINQQVSQGLSPSQMHDPSFIDGFEAFQQMLPGMEQASVDMLEASLKLLDHGMNAFEESQYIGQDFEFESHDYPDWVVTALIKGRKMSDNQLMVAQTDPLDEWANLNLKEIEQFNNGITSLAFYIPLLIVQIIGIVIYPLVVIVGPNTWGDYYNFIVSVVTNTWEVPRIIINNIYAIGWNGLYIIYLANYTLLMWGVAFLNTYLNWLLPIIGLTIYSAYWLLYYIWVTLKWTIFFLYTWPITFIQWSIEASWWFVNWLVPTIWNFMKWCWNTFVDFIKWSWNTLKAVTQWLIDLSYNIAFYSRKILGWIIFYLYNIPIIAFQWTIEAIWGLLLPALWDMAVAIWDFTVWYWTWVGNQIVAFFGWVWNFYVNWITIRLLIPAWFFSKWISWYEWSTWFIYHYDDYKISDYFLSIGIENLEQGWIDATIWLGLLGPRIIFYSIAIPLVLLYYVFQYFFIVLWYIISNIWSVIIWPVLQLIGTGIYYIGVGIMNIFWYAFYAVIVVLVIAVVIALAPIWIPLLFLLIFFG